MKNVTADKLVFILTEKTPLGNVVRFNKHNPIVNTHHQGINSIQWTETIDDAFDVSKLTVSDIVACFEHFEKYLGSNWCYDLANVKLVTEIEKIDIKKDEFLQERRRRALTKLTLEDIEALNVKDLATYNKLKFFNTDDEQNE